MHVYQLKSSYNNKIKINFKNTVNLPSYQCSLNKNFPYYLNWQVMTCPNITAAKIKRAYSEGNNWFKNSLNY